MQQLIKSLTHKTHTLSYYHSNPTLCLSLSFSVPLRNLQISDSQNISQPNGTQHTQRKQLEVLRTANGAMQVIRTQTVQKTSSTTRHWSATSSSSTTTTRSSNAITASPAMTTTMWAPKPSQSVDICELSDDDDDRENDDDDHHHHDYHGSDACVAIVSEYESPSAARPSNGHSNGYGQELVDDHVDFVVINGHADDDVDDAEDDDDVAHLHKLGHNLLPDTAPSLKLSNLMVSCARFPPLYPSPYAPFLATLEPAFDYLLPGSQMR